MTHLAFRTEAGSHRIHLYSYHIKKAQFLAPWDMKNCIEKVRESGNQNVMLCERGTSGPDYGFQIALQGTLQFA